MVHFRVNILAIFLLCVSCQCDGARILAIFPTASPSFQEVFQTVMKALVARGHEVTVISPDPLKERIENYTDVDLSFMYDNEHKGYKITDLMDVTAFGTALRLTVQASFVCKTQLGSSQIQKFIEKYPKRIKSFDLVFMELCRYPCYHGLIHHVGSPPVIGFRADAATHEVMAAMANPDNPSYFPDYYLPYTNRMTFLERMHNTALYVWNRLLWHLIIVPVQELTMRYHFGLDPPAIWKAENNYSLVLVNDHWTQSYPIPLLPSIIQIGGVHVRENPKPLSQDLKKFLDEATHGVILFNLGSTFESGDMPMEKKLAFASAFSELPQQVLIKWDDIFVPVMPDNVKVVNFISQQDVLAHPKVKLLITPGDIHSFQEATYHAVPLIGVPYTMDQRHHVRKMEQVGVGVKMEYATITKKKILKAVRKVLHDQKFQKNMKKFSAISKDLPDKALERAVWWTEYVLRHNGARHLRSAALDLTWYQYLLLDVIAFIVLAIVAAIFLIYMIIRLLVKYGIYYLSKYKDKRQQASSIAKKIN